MNSDQALIQAAYEATFKQLYAKLFDGYVTAAGDAKQKEDADQRFLAGVASARSSRDRAIELLG
jgi:hypothetical protein